LKWFAKISPAKIRATLLEIERQRKILARATPSSRAGKILARELDLAARMAAQSCHFMFWQKAAAAGKTSEASRRAKTGVRELRRLDRDFKNYWPLRNRATTKHCSPFLEWRIQDYLRGDKSRSPKKRQPENPTGALGKG
jgi:hypothetical protein